MTSLSTILSVWIPSIWLVHLRSFSNFYICYWFHLFIPSLLVSFCWVMSELFVFFFRYYSSFLSMLLFLFFQDTREGRRSELNLLILLYIILADIEKVLNDAASISGRHSERNNTNYHCGSIGIVCHSHLRGRYRDTTCQWLRDFFTLVFRTYYANV